MLKISYKSSCVKFDAFPKRNVFFFKNKALRSESVNMNDYYLYFIFFMIRNFVSKDVFIEKEDAFETFTDIHNLLKMLKSLVYILLSCNLSI